MSERLQGLPPFIPQQARMLILGSMPSVKSLEQGFYYAHPRNRMFMLIHDYLEVFTGQSQPQLLTIEQRKQALCTLGIGMYDVIVACEREGSLDAKIKNPEYAPLDAIMAQYPHITTIVTAGGFAARAFKKCRPQQAQFDYFALPSTSPCYTIAYDKVKMSYDLVFLPYLQQLRQQKESL